VIFFDSMWPGAGEQRDSAVEGVEAARQRERVR
jgi:hypothetical protein